MKPGLIYPDKTIKIIKMDVTTECFNFWCILESSLPTKLPNYIKNILT